MKRLVSLILAAGLAASSAAAAPPPPAAAPVASIDPRVKFKDGERYLRDLSDGLGVPRESICKEMSQYDCFSDAFRIVLGGVEGPNLLVNSPLEQAPLTAPIAVDRVALHACTARVDLDVATPAQARLLKGGGRGAPGAAWKQATTLRIYDAILRRAPTADETRRLVAFYDEVAQGRPARSPEVKRDWVILGCFAAASSLEAIFY